MAVVVCRTRLQSDVVDLVLSYGATATVQNALGKTPAHFACKMGLSDILARLLVAGATPDALDRSGNTPLHDAVSALSVVSLVSVLNVFPAAAVAKCAETENVDGFTPLHLLMLRSTRLRSMAVVLETDSDSTPLPSPRHGGPSDGSDGMAPRTPESSADEAALVAACSILFETTASGTIRTSSKVANLRGKDEHGLTPLLLACGARQSVVGIAASASKTKPFVALTCVPALIEELVKVRAAATWFVRCGR